MNDKNMEDKIVVDTVGSGVGTRRGFNLFRKGVVGMEKMCYAIEPAIHMLQAEMDAKKDDNLTMLGNAVIQYVSAHPEESTKISADKTLTHCFAFLRKRAEGRKNNQVGIAGMDDVMDYFGFSGSAPTAAAVPGDAGREPQAIAPSQEAVPTAHFSVDDLFED